MRTTDRYETITNSNYSEQAGREEEPEAPVRSF